MAKKVEMLTNTRRLAEEGDAFAQFMVGRALLKEDRPQALKWLKAAADQGNDEAAAMLRNEFPLAVTAPAAPPRIEGLPPPDEISDPLDSGREESTESLLAAAGKGEADAMVALGNRYRDGDDYPQAMTWYHKAAELGSALGECALGILYENGLGVPVDEAQAKAWYLKAARQGDVRAQFNLGNMIRQGRGGAPNPATAAKWFEAAAKQGDAAAHFALGALYETGSGVQKDQAQAVEHYRDAAENGADAQFNLANMLRQGVGIEADPAEAARLYRRAAEQGKAEAQFNYALMLAMGTGIERNEEAAARWLHRAAESGHTAARSEIERLGWTAR
jgi:TPR repeat protein